MAMSGALDLSVREDKEVTADEIAFLARSGEPSESFRQKAERVAPTCRHLVTRSGVFGILAG
jgi:hypothetical protein